MQVLHIVCLLSVFHAGLGQSTTGGLVKLEPKDLTLEAGANGVDVVAACMQKIDNAQIFSNDFELMERIALVESNFGTNTSTIQANEKGGIWQITTEIQEKLRNVGLQVLIDQIKSRFGAEMANFTNNDYSIPLRSALAARLFVSAVQGSSSLPGSLPTQAQWWSNYYNPNITSTEFQSIVSVYEATSNCTVNKMDLWFLIDGSGSVSSTDFQKTLEFVSDLSSEFNISPDAVRMGISAFSTSNYLISRFDQHTNNTDFSSQVLSTTKPGGGTRVGDAITFSLDRGFQESEGARPRSEGVPRVLIVLTDGKSSDDVSVPAQNARDQGITVFGVGIGNFDDDQINEIADDPDGKFAYKLDDFDALISVLETSLTKQACTISAQIPDNSSVSTVVQPGSTYYSTVQLPNNGSIELEFVVSTGGGVVYISTTAANPSAAFNEYVITLTVGVTSVSINADDNTNIPLNQTLVSLFIAVQVTEAIPLELNFTTVANDEPVEEKAYGNCLIWGKSLVSTFDSRQFNFDGTCSYIAAAVNAGDSWPAFDVIVDKGFTHEDGREGMKAYVHIQGDGTFDGMLVTASTGFGAVTVDGLRVNMGSFYRGVVVTGHGAFLALYFPFGLVLRLAWNKGIIVSLDQKFMGNTGGLCGTYDNNPLNDFVADESGTVVVDEVVFSNFWKYRSEKKSYQMEIPECQNGMSMQTPHVCRNYQFLNFITSGHACAMLKNSMFSACNAAVSTDAHEVACVRALCGGHGFLHSLETSIMGYVAECSVRASVTFPRLRDSIGTTFECPENSHYSENSPICQPACVDRDTSKCMAVKEFATAFVTEGCVCDHGYIWSGMYCVPMNQCGCLSPGESLYFMHGECQVDAACENKCQCRNGAWNCETRSCRSDQFCGLRKGEWGCHYHDDCKYENGGCSHLCTWLNGTARCDCPEGHALMEDNKTCVRLSEGKSCESKVAEWRHSYMEWQQTYNQEWKKVFMEYQAGKHMSADDRLSTWSFPREKTATSRCSGNWTRWFNTDNSTGCGDDESLDRIRYMYPGLVCDHPIAMETKVVTSGGVCLTNLEDVPLRLKSAAEGLLCDNSQQEDGYDCPDFAVRFLCIG